MPSGKNIMEIYETHYALLKMIYHNSVKHILVISLRKGNSPMFLIVMVTRINARTSNVDQQAFRVLDAGNA